eukprot:6581577-Pyramimonas_sp.AAC.1
MSCPTEGNAAAKSKKSAPPSSDVHALVAMASSMSTRLASMLRPAMKPPWVSMMFGAIIGSTRCRTPLASRRLSVLVTFSGLVFSAEK